MAVQWPQFEVDIPGKGAHLMEAPSPFDALKCRHVPEGADEATANWVQIGITIGIAWRGADLGVTENGDLGVYGRAVVEALHARGYRMGEMSSLALAVGRALAGEAEEAAGFSEAQEATSP